MKSKLIPLGVLDEFQSAGVFVNWWQQIRYDLKSIISTGWHHTQIPDSYLIAQFFQAEADVIEALEAKISEVQSDLAEAVETAQEVAAYEPDEDETVTAAVIKKALKELIDDLQGTRGDSAKKELKNLQAQENGITALEQGIKESKSKLRTLTDELEHKLQLKRLGGEEFKSGSQQLLLQVDANLGILDDGNKEERKQIVALQKDRAALKARMAKTDDILASIGGQLTDTEAKTLILKKLYDLVNQELNRYLNAEKRRLFSAVENLWDKYALSSRDLERERNKTLKAIDGFLSGMGYLP
jgi:type I restriction enzyme M protein